MATTIINTTFMLKRATAERWNEVNPILQEGEPGFEINTGKLKIGNGLLAWKDLIYIGSDCVINAATATEFPETGSADLIYKAQDEKALYQWNPTVQKYEKLSSGEVDLEEIKKEISDLEAKVEKVSYEVSHSPAGTLVNKTDSEIRIMCPKDTAWSKQNSGDNADPNSYYIGFKAYAPDNAESFKESLSEILTDDTRYFFTNNEFAGIDNYGRKYSIVWLPVAKYDGSAWTYYGKQSTKERYIGWYYTVQWYNASNVMIATDTIRINLSNEECHNNNEPYFMGKINIDKLTQNEGQTLILYGGSATDNI